MTKQPSFSLTWTKQTNITYLLTYSMEQSLSEANRFSASQEIPHTLWNPKVHYHIYKCCHLSLTNIPQGWIRPSHNFHIVSDIRLHSAFSEEQGLWTMTGIQHQKVKGMLISMPIDTSVLFPETYTQQGLFTVNTCNKRIKLKVNSRTLCYFLIFTLYLKLGYPFQAQWLLPSTKYHPLSY